MNRRVIRVNPLREMVEMQRALDRFFDDAWRTDSNGERVDAYSLPVDVIEQPNGYVVTANLPGVDEDKIEISLDGEVLSIVADIPEVVIEAESERLLLNERRTGKFGRRLTLGKPINADAVEAVFDNGVLTLTLPVVPEVQPRQISIKSRNN